MRRSGRRRRSPARTGRADARAMGAAARAASAFLLLPAALAVGGVACGDGDGREPASREAAHGFRGVLLEDPVEKVDFTLTDTRGRAFAFREETAGTVTLLFFGYTHCPDVCPVQLANLAAVLDDLPYGARERVRVVFVSVDPARDTAARIRAWLDRFDHAFTGLRGPKVTVDSIQRALGLAASVAGDGSGAYPPPGEGYTVGHGSQVLAFTPDGKAHVAYPFGTRQVDWAHDLSLLLERSRGPWGPGG